MKIGRTTALAATTVLGVGGVAAPAQAEDTRPCVTKAEYRSIEVGTRVIQDFDGDGSEESGIVGGTTFRQAKRILDGGGTEIAWGISEPSTTRVWSACGGNGGVQITFEGYSFDQPKNGWRVSDKARA